MTKIRETLEFMKKQAEKTRQSYTNAATKSGVSTDELQNLSAKMKYFAIAIKALEKEACHEPLVFRMEASIRFDRPLVAENAISPGGYCMRMDGQWIAFDFEDYEGNIIGEDQRTVHFATRNPDYDTFPELNIVTKDMLSDVTEIDEFFVYAEGDSECNEPPSVVEIEWIKFVLPYNDFEVIEVPANVISEYNKRLTKGVHI